jgi:hypothetical protein
MKKLLPIILLAFLSACACNKGGHHGQHHSESRKECCCKQKKENECCKKKGFCPDKAKHHGENGHPDQPGRSHH